MTTAEGKGTAPPSPPLPELRPELRLLDGAATLAGEPTWLIHDPLSNRFIQIDRAGYETLACWRTCRTGDELLARVNATGRVALDAEAVRRFIAFLHQSQLTAAPPSNGWRHFARLEARSRHSPLAWLVHNYLFFRLPLLRPQAFLERTLPLARALQSRTSAVIVTVLGLVGLYLVARQWDAYVGTFQYVFTWEGAALMALGLGFVKSAHELGHAYTAVGYGCRVHSMGIAFIVMAPLLYTDVTDSWRLTDRRQRLAIDSAGIVTELGIAAVALVLWPFMPEGPARSLAFVFSAVSVVSSLAINLNPFMRFDGYYLLSEMVGIENLQARAFAVGRWKLREWLFGLGAPCPEDLPPRMLLFLVVYAWAIWIYRLFVFVGIALVVYHYFFKALGIILFAIEIIFFVARPIWNELRMWYELRNDIRKAPRTPLVVGAAAALLAAAIVPWSARIEIPAVVETADAQRVFATRPARVVAVHIRQGQSVTTGTPLVTLASPDIEQELALSRTRLRLAELQHARRGADAADLQESALLESSIASLTTKIAGLVTERDELVVRAPIDGHVIELDPLLHAGRWINPKQPVAVVADTRHAVVRGYVEEADLHRLTPGAAGRFVPDGAQRHVLPVTIAQIARAGASEIEIPDLASNNAGRIAVTADSRHRLVPTAAQYMVRMPVDAGQPVPELVLRGVVAADGARESFAVRLYRQAMKVLVREAGA